MQQSRKSATGTKFCNSGSALGRGNGPLLVSRYKIYPDELHDARVAIPGEHTTANLLLNKIYPSVKDRRAYLFSDIAEAVMTGECDAGVLIHEGRFVYRENRAATGSRSRRRMGEDSQDCRCRSGPSSYRGGSTPHCNGK